MTAEAEVPGAPRAGSGGYDDGNSFPPYQSEPNSRTQYSKSRIQTAVENTCGFVNFHLLVAKSFYFFFFAAFGALWPLLGVYFKQLGMNPAQCGTLIGFRPFIEFFSAPFWGSLADRYKKGKHLLLFSLFCWIAFTIALTFIAPETVACIKYNSTHLILTDPYSEEAYHGAARTRRALTSVQELEKSPNFQNWLWQDSLMEPIGFSRRSRRATKKEHHQHYEDYLPFPTITRYGMSPIPLESTRIIADEGELQGLVSPPFSSAVYRSGNVTSTFLLLLLLMIIGEFFSAPAMTMADSATLGYLGDDTESYGRQRLFGSFGWGLTMFFIGIALDHSNIFAHHPCGNIRAGEKNYTVCFVVFTVLMICAFITATQFHFEYDGIKEVIHLGEVKEIPMKIKGKVQKVVEKSRGFGKQRLVEDEDDDVSAYPYTQQTDPGAPGQGQGQRGVGKPATGQEEKPLRITLQGVDHTTPEETGADVINILSPFIPRGKPGQSGTMPGWVSVFKLFGTYEHGAVLYMTWFMGFGVGFVFTFLFWHLQDIGGGPMLFGIASVINHVSEIAAYFFSKRLIMSIGHIKVLYLGLCGNIARFLYISWIRNPWIILPFEFVQGLTHAAVWAACCSYMTQAAPAHLQSSAQIIMQGIHHGLGRGCGALLGGLLVYGFGTEYTFRGYGIACIVVLLVYGGLNYVYRDRYYGGDKPSSDPHLLLEESSQLAPCGVPMNPISRNLSSSKLNEAAQQGQSQDQYGSTAPVVTSNGFLGVSNNVNPPQSYHGGYDQGLAQRGPTSGYDQSSQRNAPDRSGGKAGYDQGHVRQPSNIQGRTGYDQSRAASGYDQSRAAPASGYDQSRTAPGYDQSRAAPGYDQSATQTASGYDQSASRSAPGYDQSASRTAPGYDQSASRTAPGYDQSASRTAPGYDQSASRAAPGYDQSASRAAPGYDQSAGRSAPGYDQSASRAAPGYDQSAGRSTPGYDQSASRSAPGYDQSASRSAPGYDQSAGRAAPGYDQSASRSDYRGGGSVGATVNRPGRSEQGLGRGSANRGGGQYQVPRDGYGYDQGL